MRSCPSVQRGRRQTPDIDFAEGAERRGLRSSAALLMQWVYGGGEKLPELVIRRKAEAALFGPSY
jgi:GH24 family phage-related lysozyme (muramidase)